MASHTVPTFRVPMRVVLCRIDKSRALKLNQDVLGGVTDLTAAAWAFVGLAGDTGRCVERPGLLLPIGVAHGLLAKWSG